MSLKRILVIFSVSASMLVVSISAAAVPPAGTTILDDSLISASHLGSETQLSVQSPDGENWHHPAIAYNSERGEYLVVMNNDWSVYRRSIFGRVVSRDGRPQRWFDIMIGTYDSISPALAYNEDDDQYLMVWMYETTSDVYEIWGLILSGDTLTTISSQFKIISWTNRSFWSPRVVWNSVRNEYLIIWSAIDTTTGFPTDVAGYRLTADGAVINPGSPIIISDSLLPHQPNIAYSAVNDEYLVVWRQRYSDADWDIYGRRLSGAGTANGDIFSINISNVDQQYPAVAGNQSDRYYVVWQHAEAGPCCNWGIYSQEVDFNGSAVGDVVIIANSADDEMYPAVVSKSGPGQNYMVAWQQTTTTGEAIEAYWWGDGEDIRFNIASAAFWKYEKPAIAMGESGYLFAYEGDSAGDPTIFRHIYGRWWVPNALFLPLVLRN